jgi:SAM-dependent methyltransferase
MPVGRGLVEGSTALLDDPEGAQKRVGEAQRRIARDHSGFACGNAWARALGDAAERTMRLNLGCGDKILPGYVNVDVVEARAGMKPDVICDLHDLAPFESATADEILSVHVVEHFWRWEVRDVLREWVRVLKPGGRMIVECPNIKSACETFLQDPEQFSREDQGGQRTMWVFYGDPKWKDPLMIHRWGYTPESLKALLAEVGLADVRQEPAQFKLREPRDMRVVGVKR